MDGGLTSTEIGADCPVVRMPVFWRMFPAGMPRRWWLFRFFDLLVRFLPVVGSRRGVVVVRMDGIGDMALFRRSLDFYAEALNVTPAEITIVGCKSWDSIARRVFDGFNVLTIDEHRFAKRPFYRLKVALRVRLLNARVAVCDAYFRRAMMADSLVWLSAAPEAIVSMPFVNEPTRAQFTYYLSKVTRIIDTGSYPTHEFVRHARFVSALLGRAIVPEIPKIPWDGPSAAVGLPSRYAVMNPGCNEPGRRWPFASYVALATQLLSEGLHIVFVGTGAENWDGDLPPDFSRQDRVHDLTGKTDLPTLMAIMRDAALVVSNDTGPAHLAIAVGAPTVVVVGGGHFTSFVPYPDDVSPPNAQFIYRELDCYHCFWRCHLREDKKAVFPCVEAVPTDAVLDACRQVMAVVQDRGAT